MKKFLFLFLLIIVIIVYGCSSTGNAVRDIDTKNTVTIYKSPNCGCCSLYSNYLKNKGNLDVNVVNVPNMDSIKEQYNVPFILQSCHTTVIGDYFVEGHIPLEAINKLLTEKPDIDGIAMSGMPQGSPGMPGGKTNDFTIFAVNNDGSQSVFMVL